MKKKRETKTRIIGEPLLTIGAVAQMFQIHQQTIRGWEEEGLLQPRRSRGDTRFYGHEEVERIRLILTLTQGLGVNLAGASIILQMRAQLENMKRTLELILEQLEEPHRSRIVRLLSGVEEGLILSPQPKGGLVRKIPIEEGAVLPE